MSLDFVLMKKYITYIVTIKNIELVLHWCLLIRPPILSIDIIHVQVNKKSISMHTDRATYSIDTPFSCTSS